MHSFMADWLAGVDPPPLTDSDDDDDYGMKFRSLAETSQRSLYFETTLAFADGGPSEDNDAQLRCKLR